MFDKKLISVTNINLIPNLLKKLSHCATSYHVFSDLITPYPPCLIKDYSHWQLWIIVPHLITSYHNLSRLIPYVWSKITLSGNFKYSTQTPKKLSHFLTSFCNFPCLITLHHALFHIPQVFLISLCHKELHFKFCGRAMYISDISKLQDLVLFITTLNKNNLFNYFKG